MANVRHLLIFSVFIFVFTKSSYSLTPTTPPSQQESDKCGKDAVAKSAPFIASLEYDGKHICSGSILNENWVLIAAQCLYKHEPELRSSGTLVAGSTLVGGNESTTQKRSINYYVIHDLYTGRRGGYDIGLVYTATPFTWSSAVAAISLPASDTIPSGNAISYGWHKNNPDNLLQIIAMPIISHDVCSSELESMLVRFKLEKIHFCTMFDNTTIDGLDECYTDCSGPLIEQTNNKNVLIGISSAGPSNCIALEYPSIFVQVSSFLSWINDHQVAPSKTDLFNV